MNQPQQYSNEGRMTVWKERDGKYGKFVGINFELNGVEYVCFAEKYTGTNPKAPGYSGKIKIKQQNNYQQQNQQSFIPRQLPNVVQQQPYVAPQQVTQQPVQAVQPPSVVQQGLPF